MALSHSEPAGAQAIWADLAVALRDRGYRVQMAAIYPGATGTLALPEGMIWRYCLEHRPASKIDGARAVINAVRLLEACTPDVLLTSGLPSFLNSTEHFVEDWLCCQQMGELSDQRL